MQVTIGDVSSGVTIALAVGIGASILSSIKAPRGTVKWRHSFASLILLAMVSTQLYYVGMAAVKLPASTKVLFANCRASSKGGKMSESFRDCEKMQRTACTHDHPCTPCDTPLAFTQFDNSWWSNDCRICSSNPGLDRCSQSEDAWCRRSDGVVEKCNSCCLALSINSKRVVSTTSYSLNNCSAVYEDISWKTNGLLTCDDPSFPVYTRYGCCPVSGSESKDLFYSGAKISGCLLNGPGKNPWYFCKDEYETITTINSTIVLNIPLGCKLYSNGRWTGESYCRKPTSINY